MEPVTATLQGTCTVQSHYIELATVKKILKLSGLQHANIGYMWKKKTTHFSRWPHSRSSLQKMLLDNTCTLAYIHVLYTCINLKCGARQRTVAHSGKTHLLNSLCDFYTGTLAVSVPMRNTCTHNYNRTI